MINLTDYVEKNKEYFKGLSKSSEEPLEFFYSNVLAKIKTSETIKSYTLQSHTEMALKELKSFIDGKPSLDK